MNYEERNRPKRSFQQFRASLHIGMGVFYIVAGALVLYVKHFGAMELPSALAYGLGTLMVVYGAFRLWRGATDMRHLPKRDINRDFPGLRKEEPEN